MLITRHMTVHDQIYLYLWNLIIHWFTSEACIHFPVHNSRTIFSLSRNICLPTRLTLAFPFLFLSLTFLSTHCWCRRLMFHLITHTTGRTPLDYGSAGRRGLYLRNTHYSQETNIQAPVRIRTRTCCLRLHGRRDGDCKFLKVGRPTSGSSNTLETTKDTARNGVTTDEATS